MADNTGFDWTSLIGPAVSLGALGYAGSQSNDAVRNAINAQQQATAQATALQNPYLAAGQSAVPKLISGDVGSMPGYDFTRQQGEQAINRNAAARGNFGTAGTLKDLIKFNQGNADTYYNNAWNRLVNMANIGQNAANTTGNFQTAQGNAAGAAGLAGAANNNALLGAGANIESQYLAGKNSSGQTNANALGGALANSISDIYNKYFGNSYAPTTGADYLSWSGNAPVNEYSDWGFD